MAGLILSLRVSIGYFPAERTSENPLDLKKSSTPAGACFFSMLSFQQSFRCSLNSLPISQSLSAHLSCSRCFDFLRTLSSR
ncbi:hypothetical protein VTI28DRAFT_10608 [Corynascus sepedonium]